MKNLITIMMALFCVTASAQEVIVADTVDADALFEKRSITQHKWSKYEYVDTCTARYAVVHDWNGRCGVYDLEKHENLTELEFRNLYFSKMMDLEDGTEAAVGFKWHSNIAMIRAMVRRNPASLQHEWWRVADMPREMDALEIA